MQPPGLTSFIPPLRILRELLDSLKHVQDFLNAVRFSTMLCHTEGVVSSLARYGVSELATAGRELNEITLEERALIGEALGILHTEEKNNYSFLYQQATINTCTYLEAAIKSLVTNCLSSQENMANIEVLSSVTIPFTQFRSLSEEKQFDFIYHHYELQVGAVLQQGVKRFESLLEPIGFSGPRSEAVDDGIYELVQVRNLLLYNNGVVDKKFAKACPWFSSHLGRKLIISPELYEHYHNAVMEYASILIRRIEEKAASIKRHSTRDSDAA